METVQAIKQRFEIIGNDPKLNRAIEKAIQVAPTDISVMVTGESGVGKENIPRIIHSLSHRKHGKYIAVNCGAIPEGTIDSELFGHEKGAFTGATSTREGYFEVADGGTIFLDEIGELTPEIQAKLLRVLEEGEFERVGSSRTKRVDVRLIAATHRDLEDDVASGRFRADLYYRLSVYPIRLPALRERIEDIPSLVWFFVQRHQRDLGRRITEVPRAVMASLQHHSWPGNVRELENVIERAMIGSTGDTLQLDETFGRIKKRTADDSAVTGDTLDAIQRTHIEAILADCGGRINGKHNAAERLGVHPNTLRFRMKKLGIKSPNRRRP